MYENALTSATTLGSVLYNIARIYEEAYEKLLSRHLEYIRQWRYTTGSDAERSYAIPYLASQNNNLNLRAFYTLFLIYSGSPMAKIAKEYFFKDHDKHDVDSLCAVLQLHPMYAFACIIV
jgi:RNA polymerase-associated protein CTR9